MHRDDSIQMNLMLNAMTILKIILSLLLLIYQPNLIKL